MELNKLEGVLSARTMYDVIINMEIWILGCNTHIQSLLFIKKYIKKRCACVRACVRARVCVCVCVCVCVRKQTPVSLLSET